MRERMSDTEALMWNLEKDPFLSSTFANVTILDQAPELDRFRAKMTVAVESVPRLRQRVVPAFGRLAPPEWRTDPDFDLDHHIRRIALPGEGTVRDLLDLAAVFVNDPFDRTRPLWEFVFVEGLAGGRTAMLQKLHHTITDGEGGVRMSVAFLDFARHPAGDEPSPPSDPTTAAPHSPGHNGVLATAADSVAHDLRRLVGIGRRSVNDVAAIVRSPGTLPGLGADAIATAQSLGRLLMVNDRAHSPLWTQRSLKRRIEVLRLPLEEARRTAKALGGTVNDLFVSGAAAGAGAYHREMGLPVDELRISMPVSIRTDKAAGGNAFSPARVLVPVQMDDPAEFLAAVRERLSATKGERALTVAGAAAGLVNLLPTSLSVRFARQQVQTVDFATSNVRGAPFDLFIAGAKIEANYPIGPVAGTAFNLTTLSSGGYLDMGMNIDSVAVAEPVLLRRCVEDAYAALMAVG